MALSPEEKEEIEEEERKAKFCLLLGRSQEEYDNMTPQQVNIWIEVWNQMQKKK